MVTLHERRPEQVIQLFWRHLEESFNFNSSAGTSCLATSVRDKACRAEVPSLPLQGATGQRREAMDGTGGHFVPCHGWGSSSRQEQRGSDSGLSRSFVPLLSLRTDVHTQHPTRSPLLLQAQAWNNLFRLCLLAAVAPVHHFNWGASAPGSMFWSQPFKRQ